MNNFWGLSPTAWTAIYAMISFGLFVVAVIAALYAQRQWKTTRNQVEEARKAEAEANRPYVIAAIEPSGASRHLFDVTVKNIGRRPALNVSIVLDPLPQRANETPGYEIANAKLFNEPVAMIAPNQELRAFYDSHSDRKNRDDLPKNHVASLLYEDSSKHVYRDIFVLDIEAMKGTMYADVQTLHDIGQTLDRLENILSRSSLLQSSGSVTVEASVEHRNEREQRIANERAERRQDHDRLSRRIESVQSEDGHI